MPPSTRSVDEIITKASTSRSKSPLTFFLLAFALSIPFLVVSGVTGLQVLPGIPVAGFMFVCPGLAALILARQEQGTAGAKALLRRAFDSKSITSKIWYVPIVLLSPGIAFVSYGVLRLTGTPVPVPQISFLPTLILCVVFFIGALGEELGWSGYALDPMQRRWGALGAGLLLGGIWAVYHFVALAQVHRSVEWIAWWSLGTVTMRVIMVWLYNNTGKSVFGASLFHAASNVSWQTFPIHGSFFDPRVTGLLTLFVAVVVTIVWGPRTLARYGKAKNRSAGSD